MNYIMTTYIKRLRRIAEDTGTLVATPSWTSMFPPKSKLSKLRKTGLSPQSASAGQSSQMSHTEDGVIS